MVKKDGGKQCSVYVHGKAYGRQMNGSEGYGVYGGYWVIVRAGVVVQI